MPAKTDNQITLKDGRILGYAEYGVAQNAVAASVAPLRFSMAYAGHRAASRRPQGGKVR